MDTKRDRRIRHRRGSSFEVDGGPSCRMVPPSELQAGWTRAATWPGLPIEGGRGDSGGRLPLLRRPRPGSSPARRIVWPSDEDWPFGCFQRCCDCCRRAASDPWPTSCDRPQSCPASASDSSDPSRSLPDQTGAVARRGSTRTDDPVSWCPVRIRRTTLRRLDCCNMLVRARRRFSLDPPDHRCGILRRVCWVTGSCPGCARGRAWSRFRARHQDWRSWYPSTPFQTISHDTKWSPVKRTPVWDRTLHTRLSILLYSPPYKTRKFQSLSIFLYSTFHLQFTELSPIVYTTSDVNTVMIAVVYNDIVTRQISQIIHSQFQIRWTPCKLEQDRV